MTWSRSIGRGTDPLGPSLVVALSVAATWHAVLFWSGFYGISWDDAGRTLDAYQWSRNPRFLEATMWLPLHRILVGSALAIHPDLFLTPRLVTFAIGMLTLGALVWLTLEWVGDRTVAAIAGLLGSVFMPRVALFLAPLSCGPLCLTILIGLAAWLRWARTGSVPSLMASAVGFALSTTLRYEGWVFAGMFVCATVFQRIRWSGSEESGGWGEIGLAAGTAGAFPLFWLVLNIWQRGGALASVSENGTPFGSWWEVLRKNPVAELLFLNAITLNWVGLPALARAARHDSRRAGAIALAFVPLVIVALPLLLAKRAQSGPSWRMVVVWSLLLLPFTAATVSSCQRRFGVLAATWMMVVLLAASVGSTLWMKARSTWAMPPVTLALGRELNRLLVAHPEANVLIESAQFSYLNVLVASQLPDRFVLNSIPEEPPDASALISDSRSVDLDGLRRRGIGYLVFTSTGLRRILDGETGLRRAVDYPEWAVYEVR